MAVRHEDDLLVGRTQPRKEEDEFDDGDLLAVELDDVAQMIEASALVLSYHQLLSGGCERRSTSAVLRKDNRAIFRAASVRGGRGDFGPSDRAPDR